MQVIALTGGFATGKSTVAKQFKALGATLFDLDKAGHEVIKSNTSVIAAIAKRFPDAVKNGVVDRAILGGHVFRNEAALHWLEHLLHPEIFKLQHAFVKEARRRGITIIIVEIPLLFEVGAEKYYDTSILVTAPYFQQRRRAMARKNMTEQKLKDILSRQWPTHKKRLKADKEIFTGHGRGDTMRQVKRIWHGLTQSTRNRL